MRKYYPAAIAALIMLISFLLSPPTGEFAVALPWQTFFTLFMISTAANGLARENAYSALEGVASSMQYTIAAIAFTAICSFITAPFLTAFYSSLSFIAISDRVLEGADRKQYKGIAAAIISTASYSGSMLLPSGNAQNIIVSSLYGVSAIDTMHPAVIISIPIIAVSIIIAMIRKPADRIYMHGKDYAQPGNRSFIMFHICLLIVVALSASDIFFWFDLLIVFLAVVVIFDRKALLKADYPMLLAYIFTITAMQAFASYPSSAKVLSDATAVHPVLVPYITAALIGPAAAVSLLGNLHHSPDLLLLSANLGGMILVSSSSAVLLIRKEGKRCIMERAIIGTALSLAILVILSLIRHLPV